MPNRARAVGGGVLVLQHVEAMRIGGDDFVEMRFGERLQILVPQSLKQPLFARQAHIVSGVVLAFVEDPEVETGFAKNARGRAGRGRHARIVRRIVAHEPQVLDRLLAGILDGELQLLSPLRAGPRGRSKGISITGQVLQRFLKRFVHVTPSHQVPAHFDEHGNVLVHHRAPCHARQTTGASPYLLRLHHIADEAGSVAMPPASPRTSSFMWCMSIFGESAKPLLNAGHARSQRPHSAQASPLNNCRQVNSSRRAAPSEAAGTLPGWSDPKNTPNGEARRCMCLE